MYNLNVRYLLNFCFDNKHIGIVQLFNCITKATYFIGYSKQGFIKTNKGKLYNKYYNLRKEIKKITPIVH